MQRPPTLFNEALAKVRAVAKEGLPWWISGKNEEWKMLVRLPIAIGISEGGKNACLSAKALATADLPRWISGKNACPPPDSHRHWRRRACPDPYIYQETGWSEILIKRNIRYNRPNHFSEQAPGFSLSVGRKSASGDRLACPTTPPPEQYLLTSAKIQSVLKNYFRFSISSISLGLPVNFLFFIKSL